MLRNQWITAALAAAGLLAAGTSVRADDTLRLRLDRTETPTMKLGGAESVDADTYEVGRGGGRAGGGYRGGYGGYRGGYYRGGYGYGGRYGYGIGYRGGYGYGRPYYGWYGGYRPYYGNWWGGYGLPFGYYPSVYYYGSPYYYPASTTIVVPPATANFVPASTLQAAPNAGLETAPPPQVVPSDGTFIYDGGPRPPVSAPNINADPSAPVPVPVPADGRPISLRGKPAYSYPAYGESLKVAPRPAGRSTTNTYVIKADFTQPSGR